MTKKDKIRIGVIGASGYTGGELVRLAACHPHIEIAVLVAKNHAGQPMRSVFPHLSTLSLPDLVDTNDINWEDCDAVFCGLPHGTAHEIIADIPDHITVIDMSADFRLREPSTYSAWYGLEHTATDLLKTAVYGLTEHYRKEILQARLVACPGCYPTAALLALIPLIQNNLVEAQDIVIDAKSGVSGAGRGLKQNTLFSEAGEGLSPYGIAAHRHAPEIEQELSKVAGQRIIINFTPHLIPMSRGELLTCYVKLNSGQQASDLRKALEETYSNDTFVKIAPQDLIPATQHVRGSNYCLIGVFEDRIKDRAIVISTLDNLVKGSAGQALQNFNLMHGLDETAGLSQQPLFP